MLFIFNKHRWLALQITPYAIKEAAVLFESGAHIGLDYVIGVSSPLLIREQRIMQRDNISQQEVSARMNKQMNESEKMNRCDFVLINDEKQLLVPQVLALHKKLLSLHS